MTKSAGNVNLPTGTKTSLAIPVGVQIARLASSRVMRVKISSGKPSFFQTESGIKLMLAPKSARALHLSSLKPHGMRNFPWSPSFSARSGSVKVSSTRSSTSGLMDVGGVGTLVAAAGTYSWMLSLNSGKVLPPAARH
nr:hypothetical protein [Tanacetum cinerariifolium]